MIVGTTHFSLPPINRWDELFTPKRKSMQSPFVHKLSGADNGNAKAFIVTIDPNMIFTPGKSKITLLEVTFGILLGVFSEGTEFMSPTGRVRIMGGKLKYTRNKALYKLPEMRL